MAATLLLPRQATARPAIPVPKAATIAKLPETAKPPAAPVLLPGADKGRLLIKTAVKSLPSLGPWRLFLLCFILFIM